METKGRIIYLEGGPTEVALSVADKIQAKKFAAERAKERRRAGEQPDYPLDEEESYRAYQLAAVRSGDARAEAPFDVWVEQVADFNLSVTESMVEELLLAGSITEEDAERMRATIGEDEETEAGEATATTATSPSSPISPVSPSATSTTS